MQRPLCVIYLLKPQWMTLVESVSTCNHLVELGCGTGEFAAYLTTEDTLRQLRYTGIDLSSRCITLAKERVASAVTDESFCFLVGSAENLAILQEQTNGMYGPPDAIVLRGLVHHLSDPSPVFKAVFDVLAPGGRLVILEGNAASLYRRFVLGLADIMRIEHEASEYPHTPPHRIEEMLRGIGYEKIKMDFLVGPLAPLAYTGLGGDHFWSAADRVAGCLQRHYPKCFRWWYLLTAFRP